MSRIAIRMPSPVPIRILAACLLALVLAVGPVGSASAAPSDTYERDAARYTNAERTKRDLPALAGGRCLDVYAERLAAALVREQRLRHSNLEVILKRCKLRTVGENVAVGYRNGRSVTQGWMGSPGHRANILNGSFRSVGMGAVQDRAGRWWVAQVLGR